MSRYSHVLHVWSHSMGDHLGGWLFDVGLADPADKFLRLVVVSLVSAINQTVRAIAAHYLVAYLASGGSYQVGWNLFIAFVAGEQSYQPHLFFEMCLLSSQKMSPALFSFSISLSTSSSLNPTAWASVWISSIGILPLNLRSRSLMMSLS